MIIGELNIKRENSVTFLENSIFSSIINFDSSKNIFPVTIHYSNNILRNCSFVAPRKKILRHLCLQYSEMTQPGVHLKDRS